MSNILHVYCDGGANNFTHSGGYGSFIILNQEENYPIHLETFLLDNTHSSNEAEYKTLIKTLEYLIDNFKEEFLFTIYSDSKLVVQQVNNGWKCNSENLVPLNIEAKRLFSKRKFLLKWLPRKILKGWLGH